MKKLILVLSLFYTQSLFAQNGYTFIGAKGGWVAKNSYSVSLSLDFSGKYFSAYELFAEAYYKPNRNYSSYMGGFVYKPELIRNKNSLLRLRLGGSLGTGNSVFIASPLIGLELSQTLFNNLDLVLFNNNQVVFWAKETDRWRVSLGAGIRIPL